MYCDRDHVVPDTWCTTCPDTWCTTCPAPRDGGRVCSASRSGDPCCIGDIQCLAWSGDLSVGSTPADVWGGLGWVVRLGLLLSLSLFCCAASDGLFTTTHFSPRMPCMSLHREGWGVGGAQFEGKLTTYSRALSHSPPHHARSICGKVTDAASEARGGVVFRNNQHRYNTRRPACANTRRRSRRGASRGSCTYALQSRVRRLEQVGDCGGVRSCSACSEQERP